MRQNAEEKVYDFTGYRKALLDYLENNKVPSHSSRLKYALALAACDNKEDRKYINGVIEESCGKQGIMSYVFSLHLLNNGFEPKGIVYESLVETILSMQLEDGGWAVAGKVSDVDVTAMALQALAPLYLQNDNTVANAADRALELLSLRMSQNGDFASYGTYNCESTAQVIIALSSLGIDYNTDERFIKDGVTLWDGVERYRTEDGFCHVLGGITGEMASAQAFCAEISYGRWMNEKGPLYVFDKITSVETPSEVPDGAPTKEPEIKATDSPVVERENGEKSYVKLWICVGIAAAGGVACLVLFIARKRNIKNFIVIICVTAFAAGAVVIADIALPEEYYGNKTQKETIIGTVTLEIRCDTVGRSAILEKTEMEIEEGDTVFSVLIEAARFYGLHVEHSGTTSSSQRLAYVSGIDYLYEAEYGDLSGWMYFVNGKQPSVGCGEFKLKDGDVVEFHYSCDMGEDLKK
jgi:hypothetical protein